MRMNAIVCFEHPDAPRVGFAGVNFCGRVGRASGACCGVVCGRAILEYKSHVAGFLELQTSQIAYEDSKLVGEFAGPDRDTVDVVGAR